MYFSQGKFTGADAVINGNLDLYVAKFDCQQHEYDSAVYRKALLPLMTPAWENFVRCFYTNLIHLYPFASYEQVEASVCRMWTAMAGPNAMRRLAKRAAAKRNRNQRVYRAPNHQHNSSLYRLLLHHQRALVADTHLLWCGCLL